MATVLVHRTMHAYMLDIYLSRFLTVAVGAKLWFLELVLQTTRGGLVGLVGPAVLCELAWRCDRR